jgi:uncharacterized membrane protein YbaN (DUF454 family)
LSDLTLGDQEFVTKLLFNILGSFFLLIGILGIILPLLPATPFLLLASACYVRGSDRLHNWLMSNKYLGPYIVNIRDKRGMPVRAKVITLIVLWVSLLVSVFRVESAVLRPVLFVVGIGVTTLILKLKTLESEQKN